MQLFTKSIFLFDAFGTLFKASAIDESLRELAGSKSASLLQIWRRKQLEYTWLRNQMQCYVPFDQVTREALDYSMRLHGLTEPRITQMLLPIYDSPSLISGASALLHRIKTSGKEIGLLSNGTRSMLNKGVSATQIKTLVDHVLSVDDIGVYKPNPAVYQMAVKQLGVEKEKLVFFSSNQWDVSGASQFGLDCVWINQYKETREGLPFGKVLEVGSLGEVVLTP